MAEAMVLSASAELAAMAERELRVRAVYRAAMAATPQPTRAPAAAAGVAAATTVPEHRAMAVMAERVAVDKSSSSGFKRLRDLPARRDP